MSQAAKAQEPSMEEILASIRRIIADDEAAKPAAGPASGSAPKPAEPSAPQIRAVPFEPPSAPVVSPRLETPASELAAPEAMSQDDIDAMLAGFEGPSGESDTLVEDTSDLDDASPAEAEVLDLTEAMEVRRAAAPVTVQGMDEEPDVTFTEAVAAPVAPPPRSAEAFAPPPAAAEESLVSNTAARATTAAFGSLAHTVLTQNGRTLDDLVREMLRPMLKNWLDENLPHIVERLVRAEIERLSRGQG